MKRGDVVVIGHRQRLRDAVAALLREAMGLEVFSTATDPLHHPPVLVDVARLLSRPVPSSLATLQAAVVLALREDADAVLLLLNEAIPVFLVEDLKADTLRLIVAPRDGVASTYYSRLAAHTARRIREFLARRDSRQPLTNQESAVLALLRRGCSNPEIAESLGIQPKTVKNHLTHVYLKLGVSTRYEALALERPSRSALEA